MDLSKFREWFDREFALFLDDQIRTFVQKSTYPEIQEIAQYIQLLAKDGKRFRPFLAYAALDPKDPKEHFKLFAAIELLHIFALIHDDIMDEGTTRHGVLCAHRVFSDRYKSKRIGEGVAILLGDLVYQWSYECILSYSSTHPLLKTEVIDIFGELVSEVIHGQMIDVISPAEPPFSKEHIIEKMYLKTVRYSFIQPMRLGFAAAGNLEEYNAFAESFGRALGLMFQLQDDLIDVTEGHDKSSFLDISTNQQTMLSWYMQHDADAEFRDAFVSYLGRELTPHDKQEIGVLLLKSGAREYVQKLIDQYYEEVQNLAEEDVWKGIAEVVYRRKK